MSALDRISGVSRLLDEWKEVERLHQSPVNVLERLADLIESEYEVYLKSDPDPFDDRHPMRNDPDSTYGHILKNLTKDETFIDVVVNSYVMVPREDFQLCCAATRLLCDIMCYVESEEIYQETEGLIPRLYKWAESGKEPLRSYSTGLLGMAMAMQDFTATYREKNSHLVPIMIMRLKFLKEVKDFSQPAVNDFPKFKSSSRNKINSKPVVSPKNKKDVCSDVICHSVNSEASSKSNHNITKKDIHKKTKYCLKPSSFMRKPLTVSMQIRFILRYLTPLGEYQEFLQIAFELEVRSLVTHFINVKYIAEDHIIFQALQYLTSLMCHKKFALEFVSHGGIEKLLQIPRPSVSATAVSCCFYYLAYVEDALERICLLPQPVLGDVVKYVLWLLECSHNSGRCHATIFFSLTFSFRAILALFDANDGLRKLINMLSTLEILTESPDVLSDDYLFDSRQTVKHTCMALRRYFDAHVAMKADVMRRSIARTRGGSPPTPIPAYKSMTITQRSILENVELILENPYSVSKWHPIDMMRNLQGFSLLIQVMCLSAEWNSYTARNDVTRLALDTLAVLTVSLKSQLALLEPVTLPTGVTEVGIRVLLRAAEGELAADGDIQKAALLVLCNCVCSTKTKNNLSTSGKLQKGRRSFPRNPEDIQERLWNCVRANNGIRVLLALLLVKTPLTDADAIRALACKALCGLSRSDKIRQIMSKLPMIHSGQLQLLMREPILSDNASEHAKFCQHVSELLERVLGKTIQESQSYLSLSRITKADVVAQTQITYPDQELLQLVYRHLESRGLSQTASQLLKEANLPHPRPTSSHFSPQASGPHKKVCFAIARPSPFTGYSPSITPVSSPGTPTVHRVGSTNPGTPLNKHNLSNISKHCVKSSGRASPPTLDSIVTQYLRDQHALCNNPVAVCPPFSLLRPHSCPEPKQRRHASVNITSRLSVHQTSLRYGGCEGNRLNRRYLYSRFRSMRVLRVLDEVSYYTCAAFLPGTQSVLIGTQAGELKVFNINTAECEANHDCHRSVISSCEPSKDGQLLLTSSPFGSPQSALWSVGETFEMKTTFPETRHVQFNKQTLNKVIGTRGSSADIYDLSTGQKIVTLSDTKSSNNYLKNIATFNSTDELVLSDGVLWDVRGRQVIHKFDKFNNYVSGVFHPSDLEIVINSEIWDLRSFHLLDTCSSLDQCRVAFNHKGDVIFGVRYSHHTEGTGQFESSFRTIDATNFQPIATYDVKKSIYSLAIDPSDTLIAVVENQGSDDTTVESICRLYEIGRSKGEDEDEEEEEEEDEDDDLESGEDDDEDDLGDFIVQDGDNHGLDIQNVINDILHGDVSLENDQELNMDGDDDDDDEDYNGDEDEIGEDSEFDDDVRFFLPDSEDTSDSFSDFSSD